MKTVRVVHCLNQFFGGIGGEDRANQPVLVRPGAAGPGRLLQQFLADDGEVVATIIVGDGKVLDSNPEVLDDIVRRVSEIDADVLVAGPAFGSGRYGLNCGAIATAVREKLGLPAVTGMHDENPALDLYRTAGPIILRVSSTAAGMATAMEAMARLAIRLGRGEEIGSAIVEGYFPRGVRHTVHVDQPAAERALAMLLARLRGEPFQTEIPREVHEVVLPPPPVANLARATLAVVTEGGLVPNGNPDHLEAVRATKWLSYPLPGEGLTDDTHESVHGGYDTQSVDLNPNRLVPLDALRVAQTEGLFARLLDRYYVTVGNGGQVASIIRFGQEIAGELRQRQVDAVMLTAT